MDRLLTLLVVLLLAALAFWVASALLIKLLLVLG